MATRFVQDRMIYTEIIAKLVPQAKKTLWIATADIKDMEKKGLHSLTLLDSPRNRSTGHLHKTPAKQCADAAIRA